MSTFVVGPEHAGARLDVAVAAHLDVSRSRAATLIAAGAVTVDGAAASKQRRVREGERIEIGEVEPDAAPPPPPLPPMRHEDDHLLVIAKPPGLVVHPGAGHSGGTLVDALRAAGVALAPAGDPERPGIVHRLDRDTSGLLVVAKTDAAYTGMVAALRARRVIRRYAALVEGRPANDRGRVEGPIGRDPRERTRFAVVADGKPAVTRYLVQAAGAVEVDGAPVDVALLSCELGTGRTHQIRVHLSTLGHPVAGDPLYRASGRVATALGLDRPALHAAHLAFDHPVTGDHVAVDEPLPPDLIAALRRAGISPPAPPGAV